MDPDQARVWIIGGGRFGKKAVRQARAQYPPHEILVVDHDPHSFDDVPDVSCLVIEDGLEFLHQKLHQDHGPEWIIPCLPIHLAFEWVMAGQGAKADIAPVPDEWARKMPHPLRADQGGYYLSHADFLCPDDCPEPADKCTHTGLPRPRDLFRLIRETPCPGFSINVVRSRQLGPGVGGYRRRDLFDLEQRVNVAEKSLVATACRCHGVVHALKRHA